jgi:hypothetical protein
MTPGQLVKAVSIALDVPVETVTQHDRNLAVAGLRTMGARGRNAPHVTPLDAARVLVATLGSIRAMDSVQALRAYEIMYYEPPHPGWDAYVERNAELIKSFWREERRGPLAELFRAWIKAFAPKHNFVEAVAELIKLASEPITDLETFAKEFAPYKIACSSDGASINYVEETFRFSPQPNPAANDFGEGFAAIYERDKLAYGINQRREATGTAIMLLGRAFRENGLNFSSAKEALDDWFGVEPAKKPTRRAKAKNTSAATKPKSVV